MPRADWADTGDTGDRRRLHKDYAAEARQHAEQAKLDQAAAEAAAEEPASPKLSPKVLAGDGGTDWMPEWAKKFGPHHRSRKQQREQQAFEYMTDPATAPAAGSCRPPVGAPTNSTEGPANASGGGPASHPASYAASASTPAASAEKGGAAFGSDDFGIPRLTVLRRREAERRNARCTTLSVNMDGESEYLVEPLDKPVTRSSDQPSPAAGKQRPSASKPAANPPTGPQAPLASQSVSPVKAESSPVELQMAGPKYYSSRQRERERSRSGSASASASPAVSVPTQSVRRVVVVDSEDDELYDMGPPAGKPPVAAAPPAAAATDSGSKQLDGAQFGRRYLSQRRKDEAARKGQRFETYAIGDEARFISESVKDAPPVDAPMNPTEAEVRAAVRSKAGKNHTGVPGPLGCEIVTEDIDVTDPSQNHAEV